MKKTALSIVALAAMLTLTPAAKATSFTYDLSGTSVNGWLTFTVTNLGGGNYGITGVTGDLTGPGFSGMFTDAGPLLYNLTSPLTSTDGLWYYDNILTPGGASFLDYWGALFMDGNTEINLWVQNGQLWWGDATDQYGGILSLTPVPEPGSLLLLGTGLTLLAFAIFQRHRTA